MKRIGYPRARSMGTTVLVCAIFALLAKTDTCQSRFLDANEVAYWPNFLRPATVPTATMGTNFLNAYDLGRHGYIPNGSEKNGIAYTCKAGHIDITHLRKAADWTAYLATKIREQISNGSTNFSFKLYEPSVYFVELSYPKDWDSLPQRKKDEIAGEVSIRLAQYSAFMALTWHEVLTWFGYKTLIVLSEYESAFSWEDGFSNLLGTHLACQAVRDPDQPFSRAMTQLLDAEMHKLGGQSARTARRASSKMRGLWYTYDLIFLTMKRRNFDIGLDDGSITPWLVPSVPGCENAQPVSYPVPSLQSLADYGFSCKFEIEPKVWEADRILKIVYGDKSPGQRRIEPAVHLPVIMDHITRLAVKRYGPDAGSPHPSRPQSRTEHASSPAGDATFLDKVMAFDFEDMLAVTEIWLSP